MARISSRMADLVTRLPEGLDEATVLEQARDWLGDSGLEPSEIERIARTLPALGSWQGELGLPAPMAPGRGGGMVLSGSPL